MESEVKRLIKQIKEAHLRFRLSTGAMAAVEIGEVLIKFKSHVKHGKWESYILNDCSLKLSTAQCYMKLARNKILFMHDENYIFMSQAEALAIIKKHKKKAFRSDKQIAAFIKRYNIEPPTKA